MYFLTVYVPEPLFEIRDPAFDVSEGFLLRDYQRNLNICSELDFNFGAFAEAL